MVTANGVLMTPQTFAAILLGEQHVHGRDLARVAGSRGRSRPIRRWR